MSKNGAGTFAHTCAKTKFNSYLTTHRELTEMHHRTSAEIIGRMFIT